MNPLRLVPQGLMPLLYGETGKKQLALAEDVGFHNVLGWEKAFATEGDKLDFLSPRSPYHALKQISTRLYLNDFDPYLADTPSAAHVLDAACGIGRFTLTAAARFARVTAFDPCRSALEYCALHVREGRHENVELHWADFSWLDDLPVARFDLLFAIEALCYCGDPERALARLTRTAKTNARLFLAVEAKPGAWINQPDLSISQWPHLLAGEPLLAAEDRFVRYFDRRSLCDLLEDAGWDVEESTFSHFAVEGPFYASLDETHLTASEDIDRILAAEAAFRTNPATASLGRSLVAVGRKM